MAPPTLLLRAVLHLLIGLPQVWYPLRALLLLLRGLTPPRYPDCCFWCSLILSGAPLRCLMPLWRLVQVVRSFPGPLLPLLAAVPSGQEPLVRFQPCISEYGGPCHLRPPRQATQWLFADPGGCPPPRLRRASSLMRLPPLALLSHLWLRSRPPLRSSPPSATFGPRLRRVWEGSDLGRRIEGA